ncbi:4179_t:CDS:1, partial [Ambispora leptoticha]
EEHNRFILLIKQIEVEYGKKYITPNLYLALHINQCCLDYGSLYAFWCFSFERMNSYLSLLPNSHRQIEPELMHWLMQDSIVNDLINQSGTVRWLDLLSVRKTVGSLAASDQFETDELQRFLQMSRSIETSSVNGVEDFSGEFLIQSKIHIMMSDNILNILLEFYSASYPQHSFQIPFGSIRMKVQY